MALSEAELLRYRTAANMVYFGIPSSGDFEGFGERVQNGGELSDLETAELLFMAMAARVVHKRKTEDAKEAALLADFDRIEDTKQKGAGVLNTFQAERKAAIDAEPIDAKGDEYRAELDRRYNAYPVPADVLAHYAALSEAEQTFFKNLLDHAAAIGRLPKSLHQPPAGDAEPSAPVPDVVKADFLPLRTGQESHFIYSALANGRSGRNYHESTDLTVYYHQMPDASHRVEVRLTQQEIADGLGMPFLKSLAEKQDADAILVFSSVCQILAPVVPTPASERRDVWVDLDDIAEKCGLFSAKGGTAEREAIRRRVWDNVQFGAKARVIGRRSTPYKDKRTGQAIETEIESVMWAIMDTERPTQPSLYPAQELPRRVQLTLNSRFVPLLASPDLAQFMAGGEAVAQIPGGNTAGAWARSIGLVLMMAWRIKPREAAAGSLLLTRRKLLETYPPKLSPSDEILNGANPGRAQTYWAAAVASLAEFGIVERQGEAKAGNENKDKDGAKFPLRGWQNDWLDTPVLFLPGPAFAGNIDAVLKNRFDAPLQNLAAKPKNKGGGPRKTAQQATA